MELTHDFVQEFPVPEPMTPMTFMPVERHAWMAHPDYDWNALEHLCVTAQKRATQDDALAPLLLALLQDIRTRNAAIPAWFASPQGAQEPFTELTERCPTLMNLCVPFRRGVAYDHGKLVAVMQMAQNAMNDPSTCERERVLAMVAYLLTHPLEHQHNRVPSALSGHLHSA